MSNSTNPLAKIFFKLRRDKDGYPPDEWETLWAKRVDNDTYSIDNIPFYIRGISPGDVVRAKSDGDRLEFQDVVTPSGNSVFRIFVFDEAQMSTIRNELRKKGSPSELSHIPNLLALEIPESVPIEPILDYLVGLREQKILDLQEAALRHNL